MPVTPWIDLGQVKAHAFRGSKLDSAEDQQLDRCLVAACEWILSEARPNVVLAQDLAHDYSGDRCVGERGEILNLDAWPVLSVTSITENGQALTFGTGYDAAGTRQVTVDYEMGQLIRIGTVASAGGRVYPPSYSRGWAPGIQNIRIVFRSGYEEAEVPERHKHLAAAVAALFYKSGRREGEESSTRGGSSLDFRKVLSGLDLQTLDQLVGSEARARCR